MSRVDEISEKISSHIKKGDAQASHIIENFRYEKIHQQIIQSHARDRDKPRANRWKNELRIAHYN